MNWIAIGVFLGPIVSFIASEISHRISDAKRVGEMDTAAKSLAKDFAEFKHDTKEVLDKIWDKLDSLIERTIPHSCFQIAAISAMQSQIVTNTERFLRMENRLHELEVKHAAEKS